MRELDAAEGSAGAERPWGAPVTAARGGSQLGRRRQGRGPGGGRSVGSGRGLELSDGLDAREGAGWGRGGGADPEIPP